MKIGIDGGGTKTELILVDQDGTILARHLTQGCNPSLTGAEQARRQLFEAIHTLLALRRADRSPGPVTHTLLCMAGAPDFWREVARQLEGLGIVDAVDDSWPVLELATDGAPGLVLHGGTGSFVAAHSAGGRRHYAGGLGWRFGDPGSGYDLGRRLIAKALMELQGWALPTRLSTIVCDHFSQKEASQITRILSQHAEAGRLIAALAPAVLRLAIEGDEDAAGIVTDSCSELLQIAEQVIAKCFPGWHRDSLRVGVSGPILNHPAALSVLRRRSDLPFRQITDAPIEGVRRLLLSRKTAGS